MSSRARRAAPGPPAPPGKAATCPAPARGAGAAGHTVVYDVDSEQAIRAIHVAGTLTFARDRDTRLDVGLIKIQAGDDASEDGFDCDAHVPRRRRRRSRGRRWKSARPSSPIAAEHTAPDPPASTSRAWTRSRARRSSAAAGGWTSTARR